MLAGFLPVFDLLLHNQEFFGVEEQIGVFQLSSCLAAQFDAHGKIDLFLRGEQRFLSHLAEIKTNRVVCRNRVDVAYTGIV